MWLEELEAQKLVRVYYDNDATILVSHNLVYHDWTKHVDVDRHFIKEKVDDMVIFVAYVSISQ